MMTDLTNDCWKIVANKLDFLDVYHLSLTCKRFKKHIYDNPYFWSNKINDLNIPFSEFSITAKHFYYLSMEDDKARNLACKNGDMDMVKIYHNKTQIFNLNDILISITNDDPEILDFVIKNANIHNNLVYQMCMYPAIRNNNKACIKYLSEKVNVSETIIMAAAQVCDLEVMKVLISKVEMNFLDFFALRKTAAGLAKEAENDEVGEYLEGWDLAKFSIILFFIIGWICFRT